MCRGRRRKNIISSTITCNSVDDIFLCVVASARMAGWDGSGTPRDMTKKIVDNNFDFYTPEYSGDYSIWFMKSKIEDSFEAGIPVIVHLDGHTVTGVGFVKKSVSYQSKNIFGVITTHTKEETFLVINNGWYNTSSSSNNTYSYVHFDDVLSIVVPVR